MLFSRLSILVIICYPSLLYAQATVVITGIIRNNTGAPLPQTTILLKDSLNGRVLGFAISRNDGSFTIRQTLLREGNYLLEAGHVQCSTTSKSIRVSLSQVHYDGLDFMLSPLAKSLQEVVIRAEPPKFKVRGDTVEFRSSAYRTAETRKVEDLLRNIPGFDVGNDGRISFNGKEVDRILVEGEDLTEKNYQLLSRNLQAGVVDKIQVLHRYDENRLMAAVSNLDRIGINLTIDKKFLHRWSGSLEAGAGTGGHSMTDINLLRLNERFKFLQFLQHNTIGLTANADMNHYFGEGGKAASSLSEEGPVRGILKSGRIHPPPLGAAYTHDNNDISGFAIASWKTGKSVRMKVLAGGMETRNQFLSQGRQEVFMPDSTGWQISFEDAARTEIHEGILRYSLQHDAGKGNLGSYTAEVAGNRSVHRYLNHSAGAIKDSLRENLRNEHLRFHIRGQESFRLSQAAVLNLMFSIGHDRPEQAFDANTGRFRDYFALDSMYHFFRQELPSSSDRAEVDMTVSGKRKKFRWTAGLRGLRERSWYQDAVQAGTNGSMADTLLRKSESFLNAWRNTVFGSVQIAQGRRSQWGLGSALGFGIVETSGDMYPAPAKAAICRFFIGYTYSISPMQQFAVQYQSSQDMPPSGLFHPSGLLSGQGMIQDGASQPVFPLVHSFQANYVLNNLHRGSSLMVMASGSLGSRQYNTALEAYPAYTILFPLAADGNRNLAIQMKCEQYFKAIRSKISLQVSGMYLEDRLLYNGLKSRNRVDNLRIQPRWTSGFSGTVNMEVVITSLYMRNLTVPDKGDASRFSQWQHQGYAKARARFSDKLFAAVQYNAYRLSPGNFFQSLDGYAKWNVHRSWSVSVYAHNILQSRVIRQRQFSVNAQSEQAFALVGRYFMTRLQWQF